MDSAGWDEYKKKKQLLPKMKSTIFFLCANWLLKNGKAEQNLWSTKKTRNSKNVWLTNKLKNNQKITN